MRPQVAIIIVNWNGKQDTLACLSSLRLDRYPSKQILVVDNGSGDQSPAAIRRSFPEVTLIETGANLGFTGGNNVGIRRALKDGAHYLYLMNNDTVSEPAALCRLVEVAESDPRIALVTPVIHYFDRPGDVWFAGASINLARGDAAHDNRRVPSRADPPREIPWASGCAMLVKADWMRALGGFDERYFLMWEDVDLCLRLRKLGGSIVLVPAARVWHKVSRSLAKPSTNAWYYYIRNNLLMLRLHAAGDYPTASVLIVARRLREALREIRSGWSGVQRLAATARAVRDHLIGRYGPLPRNGGGPTGPVGGEGP